MSGSARLRELLAQCPHLPLSERACNELTAFIDEPEIQLTRLAPELASIVCDLLDDVAICSNDIGFQGQYLACGPTSPCDACQLRARVEALP